MRSSNDSSRFTSDSVRSYYDRIAPDYERRRFSSPYSRLLANLDETIVLAGLIAGTALEVGPGHGRITRRLVESGLDVTVADTSTRMLRLVQQRVPGVRVREIAIENLVEVPEYGSFDNAVAMRVIPHVVDRGVAIRRLAGAVRPGGRVIFDLWNRWGYQGIARRLKLRPPAVHTGYLSLKEMRRETRRAGLRILREQGLGFGPVPPYLLELLGGTLLRHAAHILLFVTERVPDADRERNGLDSRSG